MTQPPAGLPPLLALRAFEAAARHGSMTAAAEELHVTHGAVSRQVRALEEWLGLPLFRRHGRRLGLTEAGAAYHQSLAEAFAQIKAATGRLRAAAAPRRALTVNALPTFAIRWLLPRLARFQRRHPEVELNVVTSDQPVERLAPGAFDVAVRRLPGSPPPGHRAEAFLGEREIPVCAPELLRRAAIAAPADLARHTLLHAATRPGAWARWLAAAGCPEVEATAGRQRFDHYYLALQAAADGLGVALGPLPIIEEELAAGRLVAPLAGPAVASRPYAWVVADRAGADSLVAEFCTWLEAEGRAGD